MDLWVQCVCELAQDIQVHQLQQNNAHPLRDSLQVDIRLPHCNVVFAGKLQELDGIFRGQKSQGPLKMSREITHKVILPPKKKLYPKVS